MMGISKKYIKEIFKEQGIQLNKDALLKIENKLKEYVRLYATMCKHREFKRVNLDRLDRIFKYENLL